jgi:hypothetical protein
MNDERTPAGRDDDQPVDANGDNSSNIPKDTLGASKETGEPKVHNPRELDDARYAALDCRAHSDQARALVAAVTDRVAAHELTAGTRTNKRKKKQTALSSAVERLLADLLLAQASEKAKGYVYRPTRPEGFTESNVGYRVFKALVDALVDLGLLEKHKGYQGWDEPFGARVVVRRKATRFRATQKLLDICAQHGVLVEDFHDHFLIPLPEHPLQLRRSSKRTEYGKKIPGKPMRYKPTEATENVERSLKELNRFLDQFELRGGIHRGYIRVFNNGDHPKFNWNMGGRLYSYGEKNYQQMEKIDRLRMTINGQRVCEIDIRASYLSIFHALYGEDFDATDDPYVLPGLGEEARDVVKMWITASFGNNAPITKWPRPLVAKYRENTGKTLGKRYAASKVKDKVMQAFPLLARLGEIVNGIERGWAELMYLESRAMFWTMMDLANEGIPSLAVHDSIIVPYLKWHEATRVLTKHYQQCTNATPVLITNYQKAFREIPPPWERDEDVVQIGDAKWLWRSRAGLAECCGV